MKKDAKIGLSIILGAVLLSALIIGKALQSRGPKPVNIPGEAGAPVSPGGSEGQLAIDDGSDAGDSGTGSLDELTGGSTDSTASGDAATGGSGDSLADAGMSDAGTGTGSTGSDTFGLSGTVPAAEGGGSSAGSGNDSSGSSEAAPAGTPVGAATGDGTAENGATAGTATGDGTATGTADNTGGVTGSDSTAGTTDDGAAAGSGAGSSSTVETGSATPPAGSDFSYTVQENDSAWKIAKRFLGKGIHWKKITKANPTVDFGNLKVGTKLTIPGRIGSSGSTTAATPAASETSVASAAGTRVHKVVSGDSLYVIAKKYLGSGMRYREIIKLNPGVDPNRLRIGQKLKIPAR